VIPFQSDSDRDPEAKTAAELYVYLVVSLVSYLAFSPVDPVVNPATPERQGHRSRRSSSISSTSTSNGRASPSASSTIGGLSR